MKARMLRACFVQTTIVHKSRGDMTIIIMKSKSNLHPIYK